MKEENKNAQIDYGNEKKVFMLFKSGRVLVSYVYSL